MSSRIIRIFQNELTPDQYSVIRELSLCDPSQEKDDYSGDMTLLFLIPDTSEKQLNSYINAKGIYLYPVV